MKIMVLNCGSSSIKYQLFNMESKDVLAKGIVEKIGLKGSFMKLEKQSGEKCRFEGEILDHQIGIEYVLGVLTSKKHGCLKNLDEIEAVGHRVVQGGEKFTDSVFIDDMVFGEIEKYCDLAPLHNPANIKGIVAMKTLIPGIRQVAVFDTSFHQTMPDYAYMYGIPYSLYTKYGIRRYGYHGTSHRFVAKKACDFLGVDIKTRKIISCHLGNGASVTAIDKGKSVDTSMGFTPVEGLIMGTRTGDLDLGVLTYILDKEAVPLSSINTIINKQSGMLGVTGISSDMREIELEADKGNKRAILGLQMYDYRVRKYIGAYAAALGGVDILIFTGGIGENADTTRRGVASDLGFLGLELDDAINTGLRETTKVISTKDSKGTIIVVTTDEELVIAEDTQRIINEIS
ncbi:MAG: acetate kinase [Marinilabiliales bacterium]|nr:MAG: acetate kinase [Marinilabiliales bacterium]